MAWLPDGEKNEDRQTDTAWRHRPRLCIVSRGKNEQTARDSEGDDEDKIKNDAIEKLGTNDG